MRPVLDKPHRLQLRAARQRCVCDLSESQDDLRIAIDTRRSNRASNRMGPLEYLGVLIAHAQWPASRRARCMPDQSLCDGPFVGGDDYPWVDSLDIVLRRTHAFAGCWSLKPPAPDRSRPGPACSRRNRSSRRLLDVEPYVHPRIVARCLPPLLGTLCRAVSRAETHWAASAGCRDLSD